MYIELRCASCGRLYSLSFDKQELYEFPCPHCGCRPAFHDEHYLAEWTEKSYALFSRLEGNSFHGIYADDRVPSAHSSLDALNAIYHQSDAETREVLSSMLDAWVRLLRPGLYASRKMRKTEALLHAQTDDGPQEI